jgi:hypothetical protein
MHQKKELKHLLSKNYGYKTILITETSGGTKFEESEITDNELWEKTGIAKMPERTMFALVFELTRSMGSLPNPNCGAKEIFKKYANYNIV